MSKCLSLRAELESLEGLPVKAVQPLLEAYAEATNPEEGLRGQSLSDFVAQVKETLK